MAKTNKFKSGEKVSCKKFNGEEFIGTYVHEYDCGDHCVSDGEKEFCIRKNDCKSIKEEQKKLEKLMEEPTC